MGPLWTTTPRYEGVPGESNATCADPLGWLFGLFSVPTPNYETAPAGGTTVSATSGPAKVDGSAKCLDPAAPIVLAPTGPVTIVVGADVRFAE